MTEKKVKIRNKLGLHARPAAEIVKLATKFKSEIYISKNNRIVNGKSIMGVMTLAAEKNSELIIRANGKDEQKAVADITNLIKNKFYEE